MLIWPIDSEWHCTFLKGSLTPLSLSTRQWVTLHFFLEDTVITFIILFCDQQHVSCMEKNGFGEKQSHHFFLHPTDGEQFSAWSHHIISYKQQSVSYIANFAERMSLHLFSMTNSMCVTLHIFMKGGLITMSLWPTVCKSTWHIFLKTVSPHFL